MQRSRTPSRAFLRLGAPLAPQSHAASPSVEDTSQIPLTHASSKSLALNGSGPLTSTACPATSAHFKSSVAHSWIGDQSPWARRLPHLLQTNEHPHQNEESRSPLLFCKWLSSLFFLLRFRACHARWNRLHRGRVFRRVFPVIGKLYRPLSRRPGSPPPQAAAAPRS